MLDQKLPTKMIDITSSEPSQHLTPFTFVFWSVIMLRAWSDRPSERMMLHLMSDNGGKNARYFMNNLISIKWCYCGIFITFTILPPVSAPSYHDQHQDNNTVPNTARAQWLFLLKYSQFLPVAVFGIKSWRKLERSQFGVSNVWENSLML